MLNADATVQPSVRCLPRSCLYASVLVYKILSTFLSFLFNVLDGKTMTMISADGNGDEAFCYDTLVLSAHHQRTQLTVLVCGRHRAPHTKTYRLNESRKLDRSAYEWGERIETTIKCIFIYHHKARAKCIWNESHFGFPHHMRWSNGMCRCNAVMRPVIDIKIVDWQIEIDCCSDRFRWFGSFDQIFFNSYQRFRHGNIFHATESRHRKMC